MTHRATRWSVTLGALALAGALGACSPRPAPTDTGTQDTQSPPSDTAMIADSAVEDTTVTDVTSAPDSADDVATSDVVRASDVANNDATSEGGEAGAPFSPPDFTLPDLNPNSMTHRMDVSPRAMRGRITAWYFGTAT